MQQPIAQDQVGPPQPQMAQPQQMMYCPVRLVYDTPMMMQSGEQIQQPAQNIYVNQPPWARAPQNQVYYYQQIGQNLVPIQHIDPNMFMQQNMQYQQIMPQMMQNIQGQLRPMMANIPNNMVQNFGPNMQGIQIEQGQPMANYGYIQANPEMMAMNVVNNDIDRQVIAINQSLGHNIVNPEQMQVYRQVPPQINQQMLIRPQMPVPVSHLQNLANMQMIGQVQNVTQNTGMNNVNVNLRPNLAANAVSNTNIAQSVRQSVCLNTTQNCSNVAQTDSPTCNNAEENNTAHAQPIRQVSTPNANVALHNIQQSANSATNPTAGNVRDGGSNNDNSNTVTYSAVRNGQPYSYRAKGTIGCLIQPKPNMRIRVNFTPRDGQMPIIRPPMQIIRPPAPISNQNVASMVANPIPTATANNSEIDNITANKKRKSESPDEVQKKVTNFGSVTVTSQIKEKIKAKYAGTSEMGTNTSPVHKPKPVVDVQPTIQIYPLEAKIQLEFERARETTPNTISLAKNITSAIINTEMKQLFNKKEQKDVSQQTDVKKLVRKTVFLQAKGRVLDDKLDNNAKDDQVITSIDATVATSNQLSKSITTEKINNLSNETTEINDESNREIHTNAKPKEQSTLLKLLTSNNVPSTKTDLNTNKICDSDVSNSEASDVLLTQTVEASAVTNEENTNLGPENEMNTITETVPQEAVKVTNEETTLTEKESTLQKATDDKIDTEKTSKRKDKKETIAKSSTDFEEETKDTRIEKKEYKNISINEMNGKEIHIVDGNIHKQERDYILTHVLDGYVIQESNVPFAIRKPLRERTVNAVPDQSKEAGQKNFTKEEMKDKILELSQLHLEEGKDKEPGENEEGDDDGEMAEAETPNETVLEEKSVEESTDVIINDNPFRELQQSTVKAWTVDDLVSHLIKHKWEETVSVLQEHEIDGESLFLVSKSQLVGIGVSETHADCICEFVNSEKVK